MATTTNILGTDSISSSRIVINENFTVLNNDLKSLQSLLDTTNETLTLNGLVKAKKLEVTNVLTANVDNGVTCNTTAIFNKDVKLKTIKYTESATVNTLPAANQFEYSVYIVNSSSGALILEDLNDGDNGQEIMIVSNGGSDGFKINPVSTNIVGLTEVEVISLKLNEFVILRYVNGKWQIISNTGTIV